MLRKFKVNIYLVGTSNFNETFYLYKYRHRRHAVATAACPKRKKLDEPLVANISATATAAAMLEARESPISMEKRIKDKFRSNIAGDVVNILTNYRLDTCTVGHITNDDDFKHLAKKVRMTGFA